MENKNRELQQFLKNNQNATKADIVAGIDMKGLPLFNLLKKLTNDGIITEQGQGDEKIYSLTNVDKEQTAEQQSNEADTEQNEKQETVPEIEGPAEENENVADVSENNEQSQLQTETEETDELKSTGRDNSKYRFNGQDYGKGPLVRAVVARYVADNPAITFETMKEVFPDTMLKRFGIFQDVREAKALGGKGMRYFTKEEQLININKLDGTTINICVCNQVTLANIQPFLAKARELGYAIE